METTDPLIRGVGTDAIELTCELGLELVASMGNDLTIVNAARVSLDQHSEQLSERDSGLIGFLMRNRHASPFEHCTATFLVTAPIFVAREWMRHRTQCLGPTTLITCIEPSGSVYQRSIEHLYRTHHGVEAPERWIKNGFNRHGNQARTLAPGTSRYRAMNKNSVRTLRVFDEETQSFTSGTMADVWQSGVKELFEVRTANGRCVRASAEHPFLTAAGWVKVKDMCGDELLVRPGVVSAQSGRQYPPSLRQGIGVWTSMQRADLIGEGGACYMCKGWFAASDLHLDHVVPVVEDFSRALDITNLSPICKPCHREKTKGEQGNRQGQSMLGVRTTRLIGKPTLVAESMTYDIQIAGDHQNYLADHLVVHNSFNELSGRYAELKPKFYAPDYDRPLVQTGKPGAYKFEAGNDDSVLILYREMRFSYQMAWYCYQNLLKDGIAKEVARNCLPVGIYTSWYATANIRNWMNFLSLRAEENALWEIRMLANQVETELSELYPITFAAWKDSGRKAI